MIDFIVYYNARQYPAIKTTEELYAVGNVRFDLGADAPGDLYYRESDGYLNRLPIGINGQVLSVTDGLPAWATIGGGGGPETDPVFTGSPAYGITSSNITNWNDAFSWGNHALAGYLTSQTDDIRNQTAIAQTAGYWISGTGAAGEYKSNWYKSSTGQSYLRMGRNLDTYFNFHIAGAARNVNINAVSATIAYIQALGESGSWWDSLNISTLNSGQAANLQPHIIIGAGAAQHRFVNSGNFTVGSYTLDNGYKFQVYGTSYFDSDVRLNSVGNDDTLTSLLVVDATGVIKYRTVASLPSGGGGGPETDPVFVASPAYGITSSNITNWNDAFSWGNHALAGYLTSQTNDIRNQIAVAQTADFWINGYGIGNILVASDRIEVNKVFGTNKGLKFQNTGGGSIEIGGGSSSGFIPLVRFVPDGAVYNTSFFIADTQDTGSLPAMIFEGNRPTGPLLTQDVMSFGSYGSRYIILKANKSVQFTDYGLGNHTGTAAYWLAVTATGGIIEVAAPGAGGSQTLAQTLTLGNEFTAAQSIIQKDASNVTIGAWYNDGGIGTFELGGNTGIAKFSADGDGHAMMGEIDLMNAAYTFSTVITTAATAARTAQIQDSSGVFAWLDDITLTGFTNANGFTGNIAAKNLSLTTSVANTQLIYSNSGALAGSANYTFNGSTVALIGNETITRSTSGATAGVSGLFMQVSNDFTGPAASVGSVFSAGFSIFTANIDATQNLSDSAIYSANLNIGRISSNGTGTVSYTGTLLQTGGGNIRAYSANGVVVQLNSLAATTVSVTLSHVAGMQVYAPQASNGSAVSSTLLPNITNYYGLILAASDEYANAGGKITNRWGIYQAGLNDTNYFNGPMTFNQLAGGGNRIAVVSNAGALAGATIGTGLSYAAGTLTATGVQYGTAGSYSSGAKQTFTESATLAAIRFAGVGANPSSLSTGDMWYRTDLNAFFGAFNATARQFASLDGTEYFTNKRVSFAAGTNSVAPIQFAAGTNLLTPTAGAMEYDGKAFYLTPAASSRAVVPAFQQVVLNAANGLANSTSAQSVFGLGVTLQSDTTYHFEGYYYLTTGTTTHTTATLFGGTATITSILYQAELTSSAASTIATQTSVVEVTVATAKVLNATSTAATTKIYVYGTVRINAGGTFIPQIQFSANPTASNQTNPGSYFRIWAAGSGAVSTIGNWA